MRSDWPEITKLWPIRMTNDKVMLAMPAMTSYPFKEEAKEKMGLNRRL